MPILFQLFRLLAIVPAVFGTLWNLYHVFRPPDGLNEWRVDYSVSVLWVCMSQLCPRNAKLIARPVCVDRVAMSAAHDRTAEAMASVLLAPRRPHPSPRPARYVSPCSPCSPIRSSPRATGSHMLAGDASHAHDPRPRGAAAHLLGGHRNDDVLQPEHPAVGDLEHCARAAAARRPATRGGAAAEEQAAEVGLGPRWRRGGAACGHPVLRDGVGGRAQEGVHGLLIRGARGEFRSPMSYSASLALGLRSCWFCPSSVAVFPCLGSLHTASCYVLEPMLSTCYYMSVSIFAVHVQVLAVVGAMSMRCTFLPDRHLQQAMARRTTLQGRVALVNGRHDTRMNNQQEQLIGLLRCVGRCIYIRDFLAFYLPM